MKLLWAFLFVSSACFAQQKEIQIVFTSDLHFGLKRKFRNEDSATSFEVNKAMVASFNLLGKIDDIIVTGDIANREEFPIQNASASWKEFQAVYDSLHIPLLLIPGNHDLSNAIGYYKPMFPAKDDGTIKGIYAAMHNINIGTSQFQYCQDDYDYSKNIGGIHFIFLDLWPDSANRIWMENDLQNTGQMPVLIFAHDPPEGDPKQFSDPQKKPFDPANKFEDLLSETYNDHYEKDWDDFLRAHKNIKGYFHGHSNYQQFYTYKGVDGDLALPCFRVDSPMKGKYSGKNETLLSYLMITIYPGKNKMDIKQFYWNQGQKPVPGEDYLLDLGH